MAFDRNNENQLDVDNIQGDILIGLQKNYESFICFTIADVTSFRRFLAVLASRITTLRTTLEREFILDMRHTAQSAEIFTFVGTNIGFTAAGLRTLGIADIDKINDQPFRDGLAARSDQLNDPTTGIGAPENWVIGGTAAKDLHGMLIIAGPDRDSVYEQFDRVAILAGPSWRVLQQSDGKTRDRNRGHEHFGFRDGVSQPGVRGRIDNAFPAHKF